MEQTNQGGRARGSAAGVVAREPQLPLGDDGGQVNLGDQLQDQRQTQAPENSSEADGSRITRPNERQANTNSRSVPVRAAIQRPDVELVMENVFLPWSGGRGIIEFAAGLPDLSMENFEE